MAEPFWNCYAIFARRSRTSISGSKVPDDGVSRRLFLKGTTGTLTGFSLARLGVPGVLAIAEAARSARDETAAFEVLSKNEARELDAIAARILPTTDTPGAREAGVIYFMDKAFASFMSDELESIRSGLENFRSGVSATYPGTANFANLSEPNQDAFLTTRDRSRFFARVRHMTIAGFFCMSTHAGNRDQVGWKLIGFDGYRGTWQSPFGYYDAEYMRGAPDGE
jgi:gluconate 2-dehydrogenase gamma chain